MHYSTLGMPSLRGCLAIEPWVEGEDQRRATDCLRFVSRLPLVSTYNS